MYVYIGKRILLEIKRVIDTETKNCNNIKNSSDLLQNKINKYNQMSIAFQLQIDQMMDKINILQNML